mgnify:CR=1 FL=1
MLGVPPSIITGADCEGVVKRWKRGAQNGGSRERRAKNRREKHGANNRPSSKRRHPPGSCVYGILPSRAVIDVATVEVRLGRTERTRHSDCAGWPVVSDDSEERAGSGGLTPTVLPDPRKTFAG